MLRDELRRHNVISSLLVLLLLVLVVVLSALELRSSLRSQKEQYAKLIEKIFFNYSAQIRTICDEYSLWDDMYHYVEGLVSVGPTDRSRAFESENLDIGYFSKFGVDLIVIKDAKGRTLFYVSHNGVPADFAKRLPSYDGMPTRFFLNDEEIGLVEVFAYPICRSDDVTRTSPNGWLFMGNRFDANDLAKLEEQTSWQIWLSQPWVRLGFDGIKHELHLHDDQGNTVATVYFTTRLESVNTTLFLVVLVTVVVASFAMFFLFFSSRFVSSKLIAPLVRIVDCVKHNSTDLLEEFTVWNDEVGELAKTVKEYIKQKEQINLYVQELESKNVSLRHLNEEVNRLLERDTLTGLFTRHVFNSQIERLYVSSKVEQTPLSAVMIDADNFKKVNDTYGHQKGDEVLQRIGRIIREHVRSSDIPIRMGGEEILILLPDTPLEGARQLAERLRAMVECEFAAEPYKTTISLGVTQLRADDTIESFLKRADDAVYASKTAGKNRTTVVE